MSDLTNQFYYPKEIIDEWKLCENNNESIKSPISHIGSKLSSIESIWYTFHQAKTLKKLLKGYKYISKDKKILANEHKTSKRIRKPNKIYEVTDDINNSETSTIKKSRKRKKLLLHLILVLNLMIPLNKLIN